LLAWHARYAEDVCKNEYRVEQNPNGQSKDSRISDSDRLKARARGVLSTARLQNKTHDTLRYNSYCTYLTSELPCAFAWRVVFFFWLVLALLTLPSARPTSSENKFQRAKDLII
jgi:hypothetical protein